MSPNRERKSHRLQIALAVIGVVGTLGAAVIANWDEIFGTGPKPPPSPLEIAAPADVQAVATGSRTIVGLGEPRHSGGEGQRTVNNDAPSNGFTVGRHSVTWTVTDQANRSNRDVQQVVITAPDEPVCRAELVPVAAKRVVTSGTDARVVNGDAEIDSDDWTRVEISYETRVERDGIDLVLTWHSQELNSDKSRADTRIQSRKVIRLYTVPSRCSNSRITEARDLARSASAFMDYRGEQHDENRFTKPLGNLTNVWVRFDGPGRTDDRRQQLQAEFAAFRVRITETP